jgi:transposase
VLVWLRKHGPKDWSAQASSRLQQRRNQTNHDMSVPLTPEQRIKQLEAELERSKKQSLVYKTMLDVIAKEHGVNLVKKPSPGQLKSSRKKKDRALATPVSCSGLVGRPFGRYIHGYQPDPPVA